MSKIGKKSITIPEGVTVNLADQVVAVKGPRGNLQVSLHRKVRVEIADKEIRVFVANPEDKRQRALWGTFRSLLANAINGVTQGFEKKLEIVGVGYKGAVSGNKLTLNLGYSHPSEIEIPQSLAVKIEKNVISVAGFDKQLVGEFAALVRSHREPEPYKGKGVKYLDEVIRRKAGKVVKTVGGQN